MKFENSFWQYKLGYLVELESLDAGDYNGVALQVGGVDLKVNLD